MAETDLAVITNGLDRSILTFTKGGRAFAAVSVCHQMEYAVYDITRSRYDLSDLLDRLILTESGPRRKKYH